MRRLALYIHMEDRIAKVRAFVFRSLHKHVSDYPLSRGSRH